MIILGYILFSVGCIAAFIGELFLLAMAFKRSLLWFLGCLMFPVLWFVFLAMNPKTTAKPLAMLILGLLFAWFGSRLAGIDL